MKKKRVNKVEAVKQEEVKVEEEVKHQEQSQKRHQLSAWDDLVFMRPRPQTETTAQTEKIEDPKVEEKVTTSEQKDAKNEETTEEVPVAKVKRQGWSWI